MKRFKNFKVNGENYIFDGNSVSIITGNNLSLIKHFPYSQPNSQRYSYLKTVCLVINNCCNLHCEYCFANQGMYDNPNMFMTFETAKKIIDVLIKSVILHDGNKMTVSFFGGEPILNFQLIAKCVTRVLFAKNNV